MPADRGKPDSRGLNWIDITDFSPGIYNNSIIAAGAIGPFPAPPGAADAFETFGCIVEPNGGLGPLPGLSQGAGTNPDGLSFFDMSISVGSPADVSAITNSYQLPEDELVFAVTDTFTGPPGNQTTTLYSYVVASMTPTGIAGSAQTYNYAADSKNFVAYPFMTTMDNTTAGTLQPVVVMGVSAPDGPNSNLFIYPRLSTPTAFTVQAITQHPLGNTFGHQGRIVNIQRNNNYGWPTGTAIYPNEAFSYTDPPESVAWPQQFEIFGPENPFGYGALNSVSAGELFAVKRRGGAVIIQGDLNNPTVTSLPGVQSTGDFFGRSDTDQNGGLVYCAQHNGAWVWSGGNSSQKISHQLNDDFYVPANPITNTEYYGYYVQRWEDWLLFSNNWIYDSITSSWWRLDDAGVKSFFWYVPGWESRYMFAAKPTVANDTEKFMWEYDKTLPRPSFSWQSLPLKLPAEDHTSTIRELVIRAANTYNDAAPQIVASLIDDKGNSVTLPTWNMTPGIQAVQEVRLNASVRQTTTIAVKLVCSGAVSAPTVYAFSIGARPREHLGAN